MARFFRKLKKNPTKLLVARTDRIGDFVLTLPVLEVLHKAGIKASILCRTMVTPLLENNPFVDRIITVDRPDADPIEEIHAYGFDTLLVLVNDPIIRRLLPRLKDIPVRIGPLTKPSVFFSYTHPVLQKRSRSVMNEAEYNLELLGIFGLKPAQPPRPQLYFQEDEIQVFCAARPDILGGG
ncbi:MAG: glycosyltransferase family 9 protein, partial [SAR324 cluster bacterium]|nr:glycosyltransferase family 9 protein [SAR324 cluster bacterium]